MRIRDYSLGTRVLVFVASIAALGFILTLTW